MYSLKPLKILIFGSYHKNYESILVKLVCYLRRKGFKKTGLAKHPFKNTIGLSYEEKMSLAFSKIEKKMLNADFNIFIFFPNENDSTLVELTSLVKSSRFSDKKNKTLVILPKNYNASMLIGLIGQNKINIFRYSNEYMIFQYCYVFIKRNALYEKRGKFLYT